MRRHDPADCDRHHSTRVAAPYGVLIKPMGIPMKKLLVIAALLSAGAASADTNPPAPSPAETTSPAPVGIPERPMVRNIGIAEQGDAIIVRNRKAEPVPADKAPAIKPEQK